MTPLSEGHRPMSRIAVFCGSYIGGHEEVARQTGEHLARLGVALVYGGGGVGLMGTVADAALEAGGEVIGVMPRSLVESEIGHDGLTEIHVVETMHERKARMAELADAFIALPGGPGTLEEIVEQWTWAQLGIHRKPCGFLNVDGFYDPFLDFARRMVASGFMGRSHLDMLVVEDRIERIVEGFLAYDAPAPKWARGSAAQMLQP